MKRNEHGWNFTSTTAVNRGYWDPSETMRTLAEEIVANDPSKLPDGETEVTQENYFEIVSENYLGITQAAQFQRDDQYGNESWSWGSKCTAVGDCDPAATPVDNKLAEMPRSYNSSLVSFANYYNWYAATAESGKYSTSDGVVVADSLCPKGWSLPIISLDSSTYTPKSWQGLLFGSYGLSNGEAYSEILRQLPLSFGYIGYYDSGYGTIPYQNSRGRLWTAANRALTYSVSSIYPQNISGGSKYAGYGIQCVKD